VVENVQRVFKVAEGIIESFQRLDKALCSSIDNNIEPIMVLEEIESGSLKIWLKNKLTAVDDQGLKDLDWRPLIGKYLVRAKYVYVNWSNKTGKDSTLSGLANDFKKIAKETDVKHLPDYALPSLPDLAIVTKAIDVSRGQLIEGDKLQYLAPNEDPVDFDLAISWTDEELEQMLTKETTIMENVSMNLIIKKPDYLGISKWDFRHGAKPIPAGVEDEEWLSDFHARKFDVRPGDALKCKVRIEYSYGYDNELLKEIYAVTSVDDILENRISEQLQLGHDKPENDEGK